MVDDLDDDEWDDDEEPSLTQPGLIGVILKGIDKLGGVKAVNTRQMNAIIAAADDIMESLRKPHAPATFGMGLTKWLGCDETGRSSLYMAYVLAPLAKVGNPWHNRDENDPHPYPHDPSDFSRCVGLLNAVLELRLHLAALGEGHGKQWAALIGAWSELESLYAEELPTGNAPKLYARMKELIG